MAAHSSMSIAYRMAVGLLLLSLVAIGGAAATYLAMNSQGNRVAALTRAADGPPLVERISASVFAIVMESRGLYIARDRAQATGFANNLRARLVSIQTDWQRLHSLLPAEDQARSIELDSAMSHFIELREHLAHVGVEEGSQAADKLGNNDANRSAREVFSLALDQLAEATDKAVKQLEAETIASGRRVSLILLATSIVAVVVSMAAILLLLQRSVSRPLRQLAGALGDMVAGRIDDVVLPPASGDEVGAITTAARVFLEKLRENREFEAAAVTARAAREREAAAMSSHTQDFGTSVSGVMASLGQSAGQMNLAAAEMSEAARRTRDSTSNAVQGVQASTRDLNSVAVAAEQMAARIAEISSQVAHVSGAVTKAVDHARETDQKVADLAGTADKIGDVVRLITSIAGQTNLLALNATIEAARAGEAGKGFAVVASEVKTLATQTARATEEIVAQIVAIRSSTGQAVTAVRDGGAAIGEVATVATAIAVAVKQQATATEEISASVQTLTRATNIAAAAMDEVLAIAEQTESASGTVLAAAAEVGRTADTLHIEVNDFLTAIESTTGDQRRRYQRIAGTNLTASLIIRGCGEVEATVKNISRGGVSLVCQSTAAGGTAVHVVLTGGVAGDACPSALFARIKVSGRVVRTESSLLMIAFGQDSANLARLDRVLDDISQQPVASAA